MKQSSSRSRVGRCAAGVLLLALCAVVHGAEPAPLKLWADLPPGPPPGTEAEQVRLSELGEHIWSSISRPSITPYLPDAHSATGAAVIVIPGGGHREIWIDHEGYRVAHWLRERGVAAFVLKYRLAKQEGSPYSVERDELADAQRALRYVRSHAAQWGINVNRVGVLGFSAGGELALLAGTLPGAANAAAADPVEQQSAVPSFMALMYPAIPAQLKLGPGLPPAFLLCGESDSPEIANGVPALYQSLKAAGGSAELHILARVGHGFGIRDSNPPAVANWTMTFYDWLDAGGFLKK